LSELDDILGELDTAAAISDDEFRRVFTTFAMIFPLDLPKDPYSKAYAIEQALGSILEEMEFHAAKGAPP